MNWMFDWNQLKYSFIQIYCISTDVMFTETISDIKASQALRALYWRDVFDANDGHIWVPVVLHSNSNWITFWFNI